MGRLLTSVVALCAGIVAVALAAFLLRSTPGPTSTSALAPAGAPAKQAAQTTPAATTPVPAPSPGFPAPPPGAVVYARELGTSTDAVALGVVPGHGSVTAQVSLVGGQGKGVRGAHVTVGVAGQTRTAAPCGPGCYRAVVPAAGTPGAVDVTVGPGSPAGAPAFRWHVALPAAWPPPSADALLARATRVWLGLRSITYVDRLSSGTGVTVVSHWQIVAPDRLAYQIPGGSSAVIIGDRRWDRFSAHGTWTESPALPVTQPRPFWQRYTDAHVLGSGSVRGRPVWIVSFYDPGTPGWFEISIEKSTGYTLDLHMIATAHFMHDDYASFDSGPAIEPPIASR